MKTPKILDVIRSLIRVRREKGGGTKSITLGHEAAARYWEEIFAQDVETKAMLAIPADIKAMFGMEDPETWPAAGRMPIDGWLGNWCGVAIVLDTRIGARDMRAA